MLQLLMNPSWFGYGALEHCGKRAEGEGEALRCYVKNIRTSKSVQRLCKKTTNDG